MKDRYAKLDISKLPVSYKKEFEEMYSGTSGFTDEDLNDVFAENFNEMYSLVEKNYPVAIKNGGVIKKVGPEKVKVIKPKKVKKEPVSVPSALKKKLSIEDIEFIESSLRNDESSTDAELISHFVTETGITEANAAKWVKLRNKYLAAPVEKSISYSERTKLKKEARKSKDVVKTRDDIEFDRKSKKNIGETFYDDNGKEWKCKGYNAKLDECVLEDAEGKEISSCLKDMYTTNPVTKRQKGNLVDECKDTLKEAGYTVKEHKAGTKSLKRSVPRPEKVIIKERVEDTFTPILKDLTGSEEKEKENKEIIAVMEEIKGLFTTFMNRLSNLADDGKLKQLQKIKDLLKDIID